MNTYPYYLTKQHLTYTALIIMIRCLCSVSLLHVLHIVHSVAELKKLKYMFISVV